MPIPVQRDYCFNLVTKHLDKWEIATQDGKPIEYTETGVSAFTLSKDDRRSRR